MAPISFGSRQICVPTHSRMRAKAAEVHPQLPACCSVISGSLTAGVQASATLTSGAFFVFHVAFQAAQDSKCASSYF